MFTGIITERGIVRALTPDEPAGVTRLTVTAPTTAPDIQPGDSVSVNGVCLTATPGPADGGTLSFDVVPETLRRTTLGALTPGDPVNLEPAVTLATRLGGHLVSGHVDAVSQVISREPAGDAETMRFAIGSEVARYVVTKGSIAIDGVSLTVAAIDEDILTVALIPTTLAHTTLGVRTQGDRVNLEIDVIAKYVEKLVATGTGVRA